MILLTLTSEGGDREDGNVYYASHIVVLAGEAERDRVESVVRAHIPHTDNELNVKLDGLSVDEEQTATERHEDTAGLVAALAAAGFHAEAVDSTFITLVERGW